LSLTTEIAALKKELSEKVGKVQRELQDVERGQQAMVVKVEKLETGEKFETSVCVNQLIFNQFLFGTERSQESVILPPLYRLLSPLFSITPAKSHIW
jgi:hypothetical protein